MAERKTGYLGRLIRRLRRDRRGNTAVVFALTAMPVAVLVFGSIDFARATSVKANLQDALDAATIVAARTQSTNASVIRDAGMAALRASVAEFGQTDLLEGAAYTDFRLVNGRIVSHALVTVEPWVAGMFLTDGMRVSAQSEVVRGATRLEVAMVLDVTGSMNQSSNGVSKLQRLRTAGVELVNVLEASANSSGDPSSVRLSVVPFGQTVRLSSNATTLNTFRTNNTMVNVTNHALSNQFFQNASNGSQASVNRFTLFSQVGQSWAGCVEMREQPFDVQETAPTTTDTRTQFVPYFAPDEPDPENARYVFGNGPNDYQALATYNNYVQDEEVTSGANAWPAMTYNSASNIYYGRGRWERAQRNVGKYDLDEPLPTGTNSSTGYRLGPNAGCELSPVLRLTSNFNTVRSHITGLVASGDTNIPIGTMWGWHSLSPNAPFADGTAYGTQDMVKVAIIMTDGNNTHTGTNNWNYSFYAGAAYIGQNRLGTTSNDQAVRRAAMDARLAQVCANMRARGIVIYTVRVEVTDGASDALRNCASTPANYYDVADAAQLTDAFRSIAGSITRLRISH